MQIFLPALPAVQATFGSSLTLTQLTFSAFIFAIGPAQLAYGPLADRFGRRPVLLVDIVPQPGEMGRIARQIADTGAKLYIMYMASDNRVVIGASHLDKVKKIFGDTTV